MRIDITGNRYTCMAKQLLRILVRYARFIEYRSVSVAELVRGNVVANLFTVPCPAFPILRLCKGAAVFIITYKVSEVMSVTVSIVISI